jgi:hypothetical protein
MNLDDLPVPSSKELVGRAFDDGFDERLAAHVEEVRERFDEEAREIQDSRTLAAGDTFRQWYGHDPDEDELKDFLTEVVLPDHTDKEFERWRAEHELGLDQFDMSEDALWSELCVRHRLPEGTPRPPPPPSWRRFG